jgi:endonuclease/exonuclease/phosphatase family metal-dependent hydrolase
VSGLRLATYNLHACIGSDGHFDPFRTAQVIQQLDADIIALQEVEHHRVNDLDLLDFLGQQTAMTALAGPTMLRDTRHYGNAILTRLPITSHQLIDLSLEPYEPRGALEVTFTVSGKTIRVFATHLGLKPAERRYQVKELISQCEAGSTDITVLMGDLNEWFLWGRPLRWLKRYFDSTPHCRSFPSGYPVFALDRIWARPRSALQSVATHRSALSAQASDHLPVVAEIRLD